MNISTFFKLLQAPLKCKRQSHGAVRADGKVILRVWADRVNGDIVFLHDAYNKSFGATERVQHLQAGEAFVVLCRRNTADPVNKILSFDHRQLWFVNDFTTDEHGNIFGKLSHRVAVGELLA